MNRHSLSTDSRLWWLPSSIAGAAALAAVTAVLVVPTVATAGPVDAGVLRDPQPACAPAVNIHIPKTSPGDSPDVSHEAVRPWLDTLP